MKSKTLILLTLALAQSSPALAETMSPQLCKLLIDSARARFEETWETSWRNRDLPEMREALYRFVDMLEPVDKELLRAFERGNASFDVVTQQFSGRLYRTRVDSKRSPGLVAVVNLTTSKNDHRWSLSPTAWNRYGKRSDSMEVSLEGSTLDRAAVDRVIQQELVRRVSARLGTDRPVHTATEYIRFHQGIPEECFPGDVVPGFAQADSDAKDMVAEAAAPAMSKGTARSAGAAN